MMVQYCVCLHQALPHYGLLCHSLMLLTVAYYSSITWYFMLYFSSLKLTWMELANYVFPAMTQHCFLLIELQILLHYHRVWQYPVYRDCYGICILPIHLEIQFLLSISSYSDFSQFYSTTHVNTKLHAKYFLKISILY